MRAHRFDDTAEERGEPARRDYPGESDPENVLARTREAIEEAGGADGVDAVGASCFGHSRLAVAPSRQLEGARAYRLPDPHELLAREAGVAGADGAGRVSLGAPLRLVL